MNDHATIEQELQRLQLLAVAASKDEMPFAVDDCMAANDAADSANLEQELRRLLLLAASEAEMPFTADYCAVEGANAEAFAAAGACAVCFEDLAAATTEVLECAHRFCRNLRCLHGRRHGAHILPHLSTRHAAGSGSFAYVPVRARSGVQEGVQSFVRIHPA